jgi:hypothetical protein
VVSHEVEVGAGEALALDEEAAVRRGQVAGDRGAPGAPDEGVAVDGALQDAVRVCGDLVVALGEGDRRVHDGG